MGLSSVCAGGRAEKTAGVQREIQILRRHPTHRAANVKKPARRTATIAALRQIRTRKTVPDCGIPAIVLRQPPFCGLFSAAAKG